MFSTLYFLLIIPMLILIGICKVCFFKKQGNRRDQFGSLQERMKKKIVFGYAELMQTMSQEDLQILQQTYENTIKNAQSIEIQGGKVQRQQKSSKKVIFIDDLDQQSTEQSNLI
ncbi:unnamed protein product [Paramecium sonneborni]|uniref:Uncharacterized protein n=1 Tax=Paramecium sonneborni TaxID=65129 RepID=A0A8S1LCX7_9CILI|nr:unnamed protein product [Paramecium sonneborni]CAD8063862.1 unnamed protein product [Paramecium sonneborni]